MESKDLGVALVHEFHQTFGAAIGEKPEVPVCQEDSRGLLKIYQKNAAALGEKLKNFAASRAKVDPAGALLLIRLQLIQEELAELAEGMINCDTTECFDALVDLSYVVDGTYITLGLHELKEAGLVEVHRSNMSKLDENGKPIISDAGRVVKSDRYSPPDLASIVDTASQRPMYSLDDDE